MMNLLTDYLLVTDEALVDDAELLRMVDFISLSGQKPAEPKVSFFTACLVSKMSQDVDHIYSLGLRLETYMMFFRCMLPLVCRE
jgi:hypothetical protein